MTDERYRDDLEHEIDDLETKVIEAVNREVDLLKKLKIARPKKFAIFLVVIAGWWLLGLWLLPFTAPEVQERDPVVGLAWEEADLVVDGALYLDQPWHLTDGYFHSQPEFPETERELILQLRAQIKEMKKLLVQEFGVQK